MRPAGLCGVDPYTGKDYSHRKEWILDRMRELARLFAIEVCGYSVMSNHLHLVLRNRPDIAEQWSAVLATGFAGSGLLEFSRSGPDRPPAGDTSEDFREIVKPFRLRLQLRLEATREVRYTIGSGKAEPLGELG
jgi:hypothetical protein